MIHFVRVSFCNLVNYRVIHKGLSVFKVKIKDFKYIYSLFVLHGLSPLLSMFSCFKVYTSLYHKESFQYFWCGQPRVKGLVSSRETKDFSLPCKSFYYSYFIVFSVRLTVQEDRSEHIRLYVRTHGQFLFLTLHSTINLFIKINIHQNDHP